MRTRCMRALYLSTFRGAGAAMPEACLICNLQRRSDAAYCECGYCGPYRLTGTAEAVLRGTLTSGNPKIQRMRAVLSHAIRRRREPGFFFPLDSTTVERLIKDDWLPSLRKQANNLIRWMGDSLKPGDGIQLTAVDSQSVIGSESVRGASPSDDPHRGPVRGEPEGFVKL
jgi:hypothetical protein